MDGNKLFDIHVPTPGDPLLCGLCAVGLLNAAARIRVTYASKDKPDEMEWQTYNERGADAISGLAWLVAQLYEVRRWVRVEMNDGFVGIWAVTTVWGTAVCASHITAAVEFRYAHPAPSLPVRSVVR